MGNGVYSLQLLLLGNGTVTVLGYLHAQHTKHCPARGPQQGEISQGPFCTGRHPASWKPGEGECKRAKESNSKKQDM